MALRFLILLCMSALLFTGCVTTNPRRSTPAPPQFIPHPLPVNTKLEHIRKRNFSVLRTEMALKGLGMENPMLIRAFKSEMKLELWVKSAYSPEYELFKSYNICKKSGRLGPKLQEGDLQTPEGFYEVTEERLNPNSQYFLSFNIGYPNEYDRSHRRTGSLLMIHGSCVSEGCLAMTNRNIGEIYLIIENNFKYGHESIPIHIFPFRMTEENMAMRQASQWYPFWKNLKEGYDYFEKYRVPATVGVRNKKYAFGAGKYF